MKKNFFFLIAIAALAGAVYFFYSSSQTKEQELVKLRADNQEIQALRSEKTETQELRKQVGEIARLRKDHEELMRLRNEAGMFRAEKQKLLQQVQQLQQRVAVSAAVNPDAQQVAQLQQLQRDNAQLRQEQEEQQIIQARNKCINNLRQLDGATQQWALENKKSADAVVTADDVAPYLKQFPVCPSGGTYSLGRVDQAPKCSLTDHALPQ